MKITQSKKSGTKKQATKRAKIPVKPMEPDLSPKAAMKDRLWKEAELYNVRTQDFEIDPKARVRKGELVVGKYGILPAMATVKGVRMVQAPLKQFRSDRKVRFVNRESNTVKRAMGVKGQGRKGYVVVRTRPGEYERGEYDNGRKHQDKANIVA